MSGSENQYQFLLAKSYGDFYKNRLVSNMNSLLHYVLTYAHSRKNLTKTYQVIAPLKT